MAGIKTILITGGAGFIGSHIADALLEKGFSVAVIDNLSTGTLDNVNPKARFYKMDVAEKNISGVFEKEKPDAVFHFAAQISVKKSVLDPLADAESNILGGLSILENCRKSKVRKVIFASSGGAIYGDAKTYPTSEEHKEDPLSPYAIAKLSMEKYLEFYRKTFGLDYISLRLSNVYGPRQNSKGEAGVIAIFIGKMMNGVQPVINGDGKQTRDFIFVEDVVSASILALSGNKGGVFNVGTGIETNVNGIFKKLLDITGLSFPEIHGQDTAGESARSCLDSSKIKDVLGWTPKHALDSGLADTVNWFREENEKNI